MRQRRLACFAGYFFAARTLALRDTRLFSVHTGHGRRLIRAGALGRAGARGRS
jgi:hypothetical protein